MKAAFALWHVADISEPGVRARPNWRMALTAMPPWLDHVLQFSQANRVPLSVAAAAVVLGVAVLVLVRRRRPSADELERRRRMNVYRHGRILDGLITDIDGDTIHFAYSVNGADYRATQSVSALRDKLPLTTHRLIGPATLKYMVRNPANSIVICEEWSGLREVE
jgi:hypothetical protein